MNADHVENSGVYQDRLETNPREITEKCVYILGRGLAGSIAAERGASTVPVGRWRADGGAASRAGTGRTRLAVPTPHLSYCTCTMR